MSDKKTWYYISYAVIALGLAISGYLLIHHFNVIAGKQFTSDLCSVLFGKGCTNASFSKVSTFLHIPVGGWGIIYLVLIGCFVLFSQVLVRKEEDDMIQIAFWISVPGIVFSAFYMMVMITQPIFFCPFCTAFHILNFGLFLILKRLTGLSFAGLFRGLGRGFGYIFLGKSVGEGFIKWKWLAYFFPVILGLAVYQYSQIQGLTIRNKKLAAYDPLAELEKYESRKYWDIKVNEDDPLLGPQDAPVNLVVFSDLQCPVCALFAANFTDLIQFNKGKLNIRFKHFPLSSNCNPAAKKQDLHPLACQAAQAAEAARLQGKFWIFHDSIFARKDLDKPGPDIINEVARTAGLDMDRFRDDMTSADVYAKVKADINEGLRIGLDGTPTAFLNGRQVFDMRAPSLNFLIKYLVH